MVTTASAAEVGKLRIAKKLALGSRGALKLARQFGDALVCVRHRVDDRGETRYTTVELLVETAPIRARTEHIVGLRIGPGEKALHQLVRSAGASWDYKAKLWRLPRRVAGVLKLADRISDEK